ncbi:MAG: hypothetical protein HUU55_20405 [Myxococcales bacterium]|nr:hypothetical protein [Myxococcales bacterium]
MRICFQITIVAVLTLSLTAIAAAQGSPPIQADRSAEVEQIAGQARDAYSQGRFSDAITAYLQAYQIIPTAALLYNVAFIYDSKLNEPKIAGTFYRRYIEAPDADPAVVGRATERLSELGESTTKTVEVERNKPKVAIVPIDDDQNLTDITLRVSAEETPITDMEIAGWATLGVGVASLVTATTFAVLAKDNEDTFRSSLNLDDRLDARNTGEPQALAADILFGIGGAAVVTGIVLLVFPDDDDDSPPMISGTSDGDNHRILFHTSF